MAMVASATNIVVIARQLIELVCTPCFRVTEISGAVVVVITFLEGIEGAETTLTVVSNCAFIAKVAGAIVWRMRTTRIGVADIIGTRIAIIAKQLWARSTLTTVTNVPGRANAVVRARQAVVHIGAAGIWETGIGGTRVTIVTTQGALENTCATLAMNSQ